MLARWCLTFFLILSGGMVAASQSAAVAMAISTLCTEQAVAPTAHDHGQRVGPGLVHAHAHGQHVDHLAGFALSEKPGKNEFSGDRSCCDHASGSEMSFWVFGPSEARSESPILHDWSGKNLTELSHPDGLRRPPKG